MGELQRELNRLAGITDPAQQKEAAGAASLWATGSVGMELVGALNVKAGLAVNGSSLELLGVLRRLGLATGDTNNALTGVDNALRLPGISGNYVSTPDSAALSITGDIDIRAKVTLDSWKPSGFQTVVAKRVDSSNISYVLALGTTGVLQFVWSADGSAATAKVSTAAVSAADGAVKWVRVTFDVDNGAAGNDVKFYTSDDGAIWTQLGTTVTTATATSIFDGTAPLEIGAYNAGTSNRLVGTVHFAQVRSGIDGTVVASFDASAVAVRGPRLPTTHTGPQGNVWTVSGTAWWWTTTGMTDLRNALVLDPQYVYFPGTSGNYASTPDSAALSITGDIDIRAKIQTDVWVGQNAVFIVAKYDFVTNGRSYCMRIESDGKLTFLFSTAAQAGSAGNTRTSTVSLPVAAGATSWIRVTCDVDNGASGHDVKFYTSIDGVTWTQFGATVTTAGIIDIYDSTMVATIGASPSGVQSFAGKVYYAEIRSGIGGTIVAQFRPTTPRITAVRSPTSWTDTGTGAPVWTINGSAWSHSPTVSPFITTPDSAALSITGDIDLRMKATVNDWKPLGFQYFFHKRSTGGYTLRNNAGLIDLVWHDGTASRAVSSDALVPFNAGDIGWVRATLDVDVGGTTHAVNFYTSTDGVTWTQLGTANKTYGVAAITSIADNADVLELGSGFGGGARLMGTIHYAEVRSGIGGTVVASFDPQVLRFPSGQSPTTVPSRTGEVYTISGSGWRWEESTA